MYTEEQEQEQERDSEWLVFDEISNFDGLERLIVVGVGLDEVRQDTADLQTRSRLYRALTRAQMKVRLLSGLVCCPPFRCVGAASLRAPANGNC